MFFKSEMDPDLDLYSIASPDPDPQSKIFPYPRPDSDPQSNTWIPITGAKWTTTINQQVELFLYWSDLPTRVVELTNDRILFRLPSDAVTLKLICLGFTGNKPLFTGHIVEQNCPFDIYCSLLSLLISAKKPRRSQ